MGVCDPNNPGNKGIHLWLEYESAQSGDWKFAIVYSMRRNLGLITVLAVACLLLTGCAGPTTFTIDGSWQFASTEANPIVDGPCKYPAGAITVSNAAGKLLGKGHVTTTDFGDVRGYAVCNVQFKISGVPESAKSFIFSVPGYVDTKTYSNDEAHDKYDIQITSSAPPRLNG
jgi:hypothetical protein